MIFSTIRFIVHVAIDFYSVLLFIYVLMSWFQGAGGWITTVYEALGTICEPYLGLFRKIIPPAGGLDFSPIVAILVLQLVVRLII